MKQILWQKRCTVTCLWLWLGIAQYQLSLRQVRWLGNDRVVFTLSHEIKKSSRNVRHVKPSPRYTYNTYLYTHAHAHTHTHCTTQNTLEHNEESTWSHWRLECQPNLYDFRPGNVSIANWSTIFWRANLRWGFFVLLEKFEILNMREREQESISTGFQKAFSMGCPVRL